MNNLQCFSIFFFFFFFSFFLLFYLSVKTKTKKNGHSINFLFNFFFINFFFFLLAVLSYKDYLDGGAGSFFLDFILLKNFIFWLLPGVSLFLVFIKFFYKTKIVFNTHFWISFIMFFFFAGTSIGLTLILDNLVIIEFLNMALLLFLVTSLGTPEQSANTFKFNRGANVSFNSPFFFSFSILNFLFSMFFIGILFFLFFLFFFFYNFGINSYYSFFYLLKYYRVESFFSVFFFFILILKLGGAPFFIWKIETFNNLSFINLFFYSVIYLFFLFFFFFSIFLKFSIYMYPNKYVFIYPVVLFNLIFIIFSTNAIVDIRQFIIISTLINSLFFFLSILLSSELRLNFFFIFFINYTLTSFSIFFFFLVAGNHLKSIGDLQKLRNNYVNFICFGFPLLSLAGTAPSIGFIFKFFFLTGLNSLNNFFIFFLFSFLIIYTSVFYFQFFKSFFFLNKKTFKKNINRGLSLGLDAQILPVYLAIFFFLISIGAVFYLYSLVFLLTYLNNFFFF